MILGNKKIEDANSDRKFGGRVYVKVVPRASRNKVEKISEGDYKVWLTAPPVDGQANAMLLKVLAEHFRVPKSSLSILGGKTAKVKIIEIQQ